MNPVPPGMFPTGSYPVDGYLHGLMINVFVALMVMAGIVVWSVLHWNEEPARFFCPVRLRRVRAVFRLDEHGRRIDVLRCSVFGRRPLSCGKACLRTAPAV